MATQELKHYAAPYILPLVVKGEGLMVQNHKTWRIADQSGAMTIQLPQAMVPWAKEGDALMVTLVFLKTEIISMILKPN